MSRRLVQNFRGVRAAVLHPADRNQQLLLETLARLGVRAVAFDPAAGPEALAELPEIADLVLFDADSAAGELIPWPAGTAPVPLIAIVGLETPSRLQRAFELLPAAVLHKPIRPTGIYTALFFAANEHKRRQETAEMLRSLAARHGARRFVLKAVLQLMQRFGIDDEQAYRMLRKESMRQRLTVEELATRILSAGGAEAPLSTAREA